MCEMILFVINVSRKQVVKSWYYVPGVGGVCPYQALVALNLGTKYRNGIYRLHKAKGKYAERAVSLGSIIQFRESNDRRRRGAPLSRDWRSG